jgi:hypothetical protein
MIVTKPSKDKQVSIITIAAALYAVFFLLSGLITMPQFTILYLPIILLGVFPLWFGLSGLFGSMIGAFIGGFFVEGLGFFAWIESVTTFIIYSLNWVLIPQKITQEKTKKNFALLLGVYALTLFIGTGYILWQFTILGLLPADVAVVILLPTFGLNLIIESVVCPILIKALSPKLRSMGIYAGTFREWLSNRRLTHK